MSRPRIDIPLDDWDRISEIMSGLGVFFLLLLPAYYYPELPETIPQHFSGGGEPDSYGSKNVIWVLPIIGLVLYLGLSALNRYPHIFNYPVKITEQNAYKQYRNATKMIRSIKLIIVITFCYIVYVMIQVSLGAMNGIPVAFMVIFPLVIFGSLMFYLFRSSSI